MKTIVIAIIGIGSLILTGCSNFLTEQNKSNTSTDAYYSTAAGYETLVNACYSTLRDVYGGNTKGSINGNVEMFEAGTDLFEIDKRTGNLVSNNNGLGNYMNLTPADNVVANFYTTVYQSIKRCNDAIHYSTGQSTTRLAEVRFLRAFYYFQLVQQFGDVALVTDYLNKPISSYPRTPAKDVYSFIISEMESILPNLPATSDPGRVNQRVVNHYLALVYLTRGYDASLGGSPSDFTKAISYATAAINNQGLTLDFEKGVFWPGQDNNAEVIFSVQYSAASLPSPTYGNSQGSYYGTYLGGADAITGDGMPYENSMLQPTGRLYLLLNQDPNDKRFSGTFMQMLYGTGTPTSNKISFYSYFKSSPAVKNVMYYYPKLTDTQDSVNAWIAKDPTNRTNAVVKWPGVGAINWQNANSADKPFPCIKKFSDPSSSAYFSTSSSTRNIFLARLAETYLIRAEAEINANDPTDAAKDINVVRARAGAAPIIPSQATIDFVLDERARELAGEYHRWEDLKRTGRLTTYVPMYNPDVSNASFMKGNDGNYKILRPIPQNAIAVNGATITQNPGY
ncbi:MAG: RagB/SusD family nutrient uptake outer membrane protein [Microbacter sp.]